MRGATPCFFIKIMLWIVQGVAAPVVITVSYSTDKYRIHTGNWVTKFSQFLSSWATCSTVENVWMFNNSVRWRKSTTSFCRQRWNSDQHIPTTFSMSINFFHGHQFHFFDFSTNNKYPILYNVLKNELNVFFCVLQQHNLISDPA